METRRPFGRIFPAVNAILYLLTFAADALLKKIKFFAEKIKCDPGCGYISKIYNSQNCVQIMIASTLYSTATASFTSDYFSYGSESKPMKYLKGDLKLYNLFIFSGLYYSVQVRGPYPFLFPVLGFFK